MEMYKPGYLGKVIPASDPAKLTDFVQNKFDAFSKVYDTCKEQSANITNIQQVETKEGESTLSVKITADSATVSNIAEKAKEDESVKVEGDVVTATITEKKD